MINEYPKIPPVTLTYSTILILLAIISKVFENSILINIIKIDYKKVFAEYQFWRLITAYFYIGKLSPKFIFNFLLYFRRMKSNEIKFMKKKKSHEFLMMFFHLMIIIHIFNYLGNHFFQIKVNSFLFNQLMFSIIIINSKRAPNKIFRFYFAEIENKYVPYFLFSIKTVRNNRDYIKHIFRFIPGFFYYWIKDIIPKSGLFLHPFIINKSNYKKKQKK